MQDDLLNWVRRQEAIEGFTISIDISNLINPMLTFHCEMSGEYKPRIKPTCTIKHILLLFVFWPLKKREAILEF